MGLEERWISLLGRLSSATTVRVALAHPIEPAPWRLGAAQHVSSSLRGFQVEPSSMGRGCVVGSWGTQAGTLLVRGSAPQPAQRRAAQHGRVEQTRAERRSAEPEQSLCRAALCCPAEPEQSQSTSQSRARAEQSLFARCCFRAELEQTFFVRAELEQSLCAFLFPWLLQAGAIAITVTSSCPSPHYRARALPIAIAIVIGPRACLLSEGKSQSTNALLLAMTFLDSGSGVAIAACSGAVSLPGGVPETATLKLLTQAIASRFLPQLPLPCFGPSANASPRRRLLIFAVRILSPE